MLPFVYCVHIRLTKNSVYQGTIYNIVTITRAVVTENTMHDSAFSRPLKKVTEQISMCFYNIQMFYFSLFLHQVNKH